jgi:subtilisin family serine protease
VAPGNKVVEAAAVNNLLLLTHPELDAGVSPVDTRRMMYLSGSSMATPVVAGAAALLLQTNPKLTPNLIKAILMYTAQPLAGYNLLEQGAGAVNIEGALRLAKDVRTDLTSLTPLGKSLLTATALPVPQTTIAAHTFTWAQGILLGRSYATGLDLITKYQEIYDLGVLVTDGVLVNDGVLVTDYTKLTIGVLVTDNIILSSGGMLGSGTIYLRSGVLVTDSIFISDGVLVTDSFLAADSIAQAMSASTRGDYTSAMTSKVDTGVDCLNY